MYRNLLLIIRLCCHYVICKFPNFIAHALSISISVHAIRVMHVHQIGQDLPVACSEQTYWGDGSWALHKLLLYSDVIHGNMRVDA